MIEVVELKLRESGKKAFYNPRGLKLALKDQVIVEVDRGMDYGRILKEPEVKQESEIPMPLKSVIRIANEKDLEKITQNRYKAKEALYTCKKKIQDHKLEMKLIVSEYSFDLSQLIFYFTAEGRVDFRSLVKDLAAIFKTRIELRQIGARDETKIFGGIGPCGRGLCCSTFLKEFQPVTIKMARDQNLSLNPSKISGVCGRLMCCLAYENENYQISRKNLPRIGSTLKVGEIETRVIDLNIIKKQVLLSYPDDAASQGKRSEWIDFKETPASEFVQNKMKTEKVT